MDVGVSDIYLKLAAATALGVLISGWLNARTKVRTSDPRTWENRRISSPLRGWFTANK